MKGFNVKRTNAMRLAGAMAAAACYLGASPAHALTAGPSPFNVTVTLADFCTVTAGNVGFGTINAGAAATNTASTVNLTCNKGVTATVALDNGSNASGTQKRMKGAVVTTDFLNYLIDVPTNSTTCPAAGAGPEWNASNTFTATSLFTATGGLKTIIICASIPAAQYPSGQAYSDTVNVTVTYN